MNFRNCRFVTSATTPKDRPKDNLPAVMMVGRSNVGKSTLINSLLGQRIAFSSKKAGKTKLLNYFLVDNSFYLVDSPGYGSTDYATMSTIQFSSMMEGYLKEPSLKGVVLLMDLRREPGKDDLAFVDYLLHSGKPIALVLTKVDQMNQSAKAKAIKMAEGLGFERILLSDQKGPSTEKIRLAIASLSKR